MPQNRNTQSGSVLVYILIGVALFSMVMFAVSRGNNTSTTTMSKAQAKTAATDLLDYSNAVASAVQKLITKGCSENEISFEHSAAAGYANPNSPSSGDKRCWVFDPAGGNVTPRAASTFSAYEILFVGASRMPDVGTNCNNSSCSELYIMARFDGAKGKVLCDTINKTLGYTISLPSTTYIENTPRYNGTFSYHNAYSAAMLGWKTGCFNWSPDPEVNYFFHVLLAR